MFFGFINVLDVFTAHECSMRNFCVSFKWVNSDMCFSIAIDKDFRKLTKVFQARQRENDYRILQNLFAQQAGPNRKWFAEQLGLSSYKPNFFRLPDVDNRVFPGYFADVIVEEDGERIIRPMRYRIRPNGTREEVPDKFGVYNARLDSLTSKKTWQPLFMRRHGLVPFTNFYEWVLDPNEKSDLGLFNFLEEDDKQRVGDNQNAKKRLISFYPSGREIMWAPCLWDEWISPDGQISFCSFAIITTDPPREVSRMGHDRCPIFLKQEYIREWLNPHSSSVEEIFGILGEAELCQFEYKWAI